MFDNVYQLFVVLSSCLYDVHEYNNEHCSGLTISNTPTVSSGRPSKKYVSSELEQRRSIGMKKLLLESISSSLICTPLDINIFIHCTLFFIQFTTAELTKCTENCLNYLKKQKFIQFDHVKKKWCSTQLGRACLASNLPILDSIILFEYLSIAQSNMILSNDLYSIFLITPIFQTIEPDWKLYFNIYSELNPIQLAIAKQIGIEESKLFNSMVHGASTVFNEPFLKLKYRRFWNALILYEIIIETNQQIILEKFGITR
jgi:hypothetical protein